MQYNFFGDGVYSIPTDLDFGFSENDSSPVSAVTERENSQKKINATYEQNRLVQWFRVKR